MNSIIIIKSIMIVVLVSIASYTDYKDRLIKNNLTFTFIILGILVNTIANPPQGFLTGVSGLIAGFVALFLPYLMNAMGAGDLKLMAAIGAITNPTIVLYVTVITTIVGGVMIVIVRIKQKQMLSTLKRMGMLILYGLFTVLSKLSPHPKLVYYREMNQLIMTDDRIDYIPYGIAIAGGAIITVILVLNGYIPGLTL